MSELRERVKEKLPEADAGAGFSVKKGEDHPGGPVKNGGPKQLALLVTLVLYFLVSSVS